ncbi:MFS general substrate transporter [Gonapodya prolifera JEL478]|uniref:MFS general substrate transporter n=1 Tax=Gonapodya prolifera (strain JEL478) TaxID=1344416 RepID=A0A139APD6_GONPJ|nr:MFS general substrate transporter [Gonapodya prolifera JEL478]|eukprot:KXS18373.1 MFS general substrate transporter [Gonapodya prolifera JEL478]
MSFSSAIGLSTVASLPPSGIVLLIARCVRLFAYGMIGIPLALYLSELGLSDVQIGAMLTLTLAGDAVFSLLVSWHADRVGRRAMLVLGAILMAAGGAVFAWAPLEGAQRFAVLAVAGIFGVISPSGMEVGPFQALESSSLADFIQDASDRTMVFAWSQSSAYLSSALGGLCSGLLVGASSQYGLSKLDSYRLVAVSYSVLGIMLALLFLSLGSDVEVDKDDDHAITDRLVTRPAADATIPPSFMPTLVHLCLLFALDAFAGSLVTGSLLAYWFHVRFDLNLSRLAPILSASTVVAGISTLLAPHVARRIGLVRTMVFTHLPSNVLISLLPSTVPNLSLAVTVLFARFSISQMDVAPRTAYISSIVPSSSRTAILGTTNIVRSVAGSLGPAATGWLVARGRFDAAFWACGAMKITYDLLLLWSFDSVKPVNETVVVDSTSSPAPPSAHDEESAPEQPSADERTPLVRK